MSTTQTVSVNQTLLQVLAAPAGAAAELQSAATADGVTVEAFSDALMAFLNEQGASLRVAEGRGERSAGGSSLPPGGEPLPLHDEPLHDEPLLVEPAPQNSEDPQLSTLISELLAVAAGPQPSERISEPMRQLAQQLQLQLQIQQQQASQQPVGPPGEQPATAADAAKAEQVASLLNLEQSPPAGPGEHHPGPDQHLAAKSSEDNKGPNQLAPEWAGGLDDALPASADMDPVTRVAAGVQGASTDGRTPNAEAESIAQSLAAGVRPAAEAQPRATSVAAQGGTVTRDMAAVGLETAVAADGGTRGGEQSAGDREPGRGEQFRSAMAASRADAAAAGREGGDNLIKSVTGALASMVAETAAASEAPRSVGGLPGIQQLQQAYRAESGAGVSLQLPERFNSPQWTPGVSQRIVWMARQQLGQAELRLDPPELGSLNIRLSIQHDQASLSFSSPHAHVREALEQQMPRLREMLAESGIELQQSDVSDQSPSRQSPGQQHAGAMTESDADGAEPLPASPASASAALSLVDYYA